MNNEVLTVSRDGRAVVVCDGLIGCYGVGRDLIRALEDYVLALREYADLDWVKDSAFHHTALRGLLMCENDGDQTEVPA